MFKSSVTSVSVLGTVKVSNLEFCNKLRQWIFGWFFGNYTVIFTNFVTSGQDIYILLASVVGFFISTSRCINIVCQAALYHCSTIGGQYVILYTGLYSPWVVFALLNLQTIPPRLEFTQTQLCLKKNNWIHRNSQSLKFTH